MVVVAVAVIARHVMGREGSIRIRFVAPDAPRRVFAPDVMVAAVPTPLAPDCVSVRSVLVLATAVRAKGPEWSAETTFVQAIGNRRYLFWSIG